LKRTDFTTDFARVHEMVKNAEQRCKMLATSTSVWPKLQVLRFCGGAIFFH